MSKRALLLTAATAALLTGPVLGDDFTDIKTKVTQAVKTSTAANGSPGNIHIESAGSVVIGAAGPAVEIDSPNTVFNEGTISNTDTDAAVGVQLDATPAGNGQGADVVALDSKGTIDLSGSKGSNKTGILVAIPSSDTSGDPSSFNGGITLEAGSTLKVTGDGADGLAIGNNATLNGNVSLGGSITLSGGTNMNGILIGTATGTDTPAVLNGNLTLVTGATIGVTGDNSFGLNVNPNSSITGDLDLEGIVTVAPTDVKSTSSGSGIGVQLGNNSAGNVLGGNFIIGSSGGVNVSGVAAQGVVLFGSIGGDLTNNGAISAFGSGTPSSTAVNPIGGTALAIAGSITNGILNNGPINSGDSTVVATIQGNGAVPVLLISPTADGATPSGNLTIGPYLGTDRVTAAPEGAYGFINRGKIVTLPANADQTNTTAVRIEGAGSDITLISGAFFSSGSITAAASGDTKQTGPMGVTAFLVGSGGNVPVLINSNQNSSSAGTIVAQYGGETVGGTAVAVHVLEGGTLNRIDNQGTINATATITDTSISKTLTTRAIWDESGTLSEIDNSGTISVVATPLDDKSQVTIAVDMGESTQATKIDNSGTIIGDMILGSGADRILVHGTNGQAASIVGDIAYGGTSMSGGAPDFLQIDDHATVLGAISERPGGQLNVDVTQGGSLTLTNDSIDIDKRFEVNQMSVGPGATLGLSLSQTYNLAANPTAGAIVTASGQVTLESQAILNLPFQGFLAGQTPGEASKFVLIETPLDQLNVDLSSLQQQVCTQVPFLFENTDQQCLVVAPNSTDTRSQLVFNLTPKTAEEVGLTGYALKMFPLANQALANDDQLGAAVIVAGAPVNGVPLTQAEGQSLYEGIYSQFAPNVTGASRALAIALTDQATGPVAARQRALRMYAGQPGDTTLWGQEFNISLNANANQGTIGYRDTGFGFVLGMDGGDPANGRYGGALSFYSGNINEKQPRKSKTNSEWALLTGYTDWRGRGLFFDTQISAGVGQLDGKRTLDVAGITRQAEGKRAALLGAIGATTGVIFTSGSTIFTPLVSLDGLAMREEGYTEHGGGDPTGGDAFDLKVAPTYYDSARVFAGLDLRQDLNLGDFYLQPEGRAGYRYDFISDAEKVKASFVSTPGTNFSLTGPDPAQGNMVLGGSIASTTGAWSVGVNYDYIRGSNGSVSQEGTISLVGRI
ncbi:MAG TPA: autotransporter domain-containing protein [Rhizomicrobium sp.]